MARILHLETSGALCSVCLSEHDRVLAEAATTEPYDHMAHITLLLRRVMDAAGISLGDLQAVAVSAGPGSFSGLRIGAAVAKALCYASGRPLLAVSTLAALAAAARNAHPGQPRYAAAMEARKSELFFALYDSALQPLSAPACIDLKENPLAGWSLPVVLAGSAASVCARHWQLARAIADDRLLPHATSMVPVARALFAEKNFADPKTFEPLYLKPVYLTGKAAQKFNQ